MSEMAQDNCNSSSFERHHKTDVVLQESQSEKFRFLVDHASDQIALLGEDCRFRYVNEAFCQRHGYTCDELLSMREYDLNVNGSPEEFRQLWHLAQQQDVRLEVQHRVKSGEIFELEVSLKYFTFDGEAFLCGFGRDISDRKRAQEILMQQQEQLRLFVKHAPAGVAMFDQKMRYMAVSDRWLTSYKLDDQNFVGRSHYDVFPEMPKRWKEIHQRCLAGAVEACEEDLFVRADGSQQWIRWEIHPWRNSRNEIGGIIVFSEDITDRKQAEADLRDSEERYRVLADAIPQFVFVTTTEGQNEYVNRQFCEYTGLTFKQMLGSGWLTIIHPDDRDHARERWMASVESGEFYEIEYRFRRFDGTYRWFLGQGIPLKNEQGQVTRWFGTCTDIDQQKQIEVERLQLLKQEQAAREAAERANRIKDEFLAVISHELRTPLNPILGWSKLLHGGRLNAAKTSEALATISRNAQLQAQLIDDLLDISRIIRGKLTLNPAPVSLASVIWAAINTVRLSAEAKRIEITAQLEPNIRQVYSDAGRLQQVVWNLLSNAVKFTPSEGRVEVRLMQVNDYAQLQVIDTGKGINPEFLPYVFEHFRQEDGATTRKFGGLGLGLAIARQIVELHGGTVMVESGGENQGATFTVRLPTLDPESQVLPSTASQGQNAAFSLAGIHVLIVDDEPDTRDFHAFVLKQSGAFVTVAASAIKALQLFDQSVPDILLSDIGMPQMNGYMLMKTIRSRSIEQGGQIPAIALSAYAGEFERQKAIESGFQRHLPKPIDVDALIQMIAQLVEPHSPERNLPS